MKKYILKSLFVSMLCMLAASCQDTDEFAQTVDSSKTQVMFTIAMDSPLSRSGNNATDTSWGGTYENCVGDDYDNRIALNQLVAEIETAEGKKYPVSGIISEDNKYSFVGVVENIKSSITLKNAKITVYANMGDKAQNRTFKQKEDFIPMWGFQTMSELKLEPGTRTKIEPISLLRAMAKIEVALNEEMAQDYTLSGVTLNKYNEKGNSLPTIPTDNYGKPENTKQLDQEKVFNVYSPIDKGEDLLFVENETNASWSVYLPEVENNGDLEITVEFDNGDTGKFKVMDYNYEEPLAMDIVRNHWYKYTISGFAESEIKVDFSIRTWDEYFIEVGMGYLFLNKNLIEMFNTNVDLDQLKFSSSSPITKIELLDVYKHELSGNFHVYQAGEEQDEKDAYFVDKLGNLKSLQTENPTIYGSIGATWDKDVLSGDIRIKSPFVGDDNSDIEALKHDSHYNTVRYLEFKVTNAHGMWTTFRVEQYPPVVITNEKGYFSYRSDYLTHSINDDGIPTHYLHWKDNYKIYSSGFNVVHIHEHDDTKHDPSIHGNEEGEINTSQNFQKYQYDPYCWGTEAYTLEKYSSFWEEIMNGQVSYSTVFPVGRIYRYDATWRKAMSGVTTNPAMGPTYEEDGKLYKKHYTGNIFYYFWSRYVDETISFEGDDKGKSLICCMTYDDDKKEYTAVNDIYPIFQQDFRNMKGNSRMYHIRTTIPGNYILGFPELEDDNGKSTTDPKKGHTVISEENSRKVSPSFMVASELGKTFHLTEAQYKIDGVLPGPMIEFHYDRAVNQCKYYVEATYIDVNGDGKYTEGKDEVKYYDDWRLPTAAEVEVIKFYQSNSRAMDVVMNGEKYLCATPGYLSATVGTESGQYMRCVRDVKENK